MSTKEELIYARLVEIRDYVQMIAEKLPARDDIHFCGHGFIAATCGYCQRNAADSRL